ncbi:MULTISPECIES: hypothetical protein [Pseudomonas]|uniref:hypothetical protein n=1 Tax=Pseudomonas sp. BF-R-19 TaxID=2832397 RepID=UPI001CC16C00|nr:hypothetical protein [Pseudomonas sp. BF-R-19]
MEAAWRGGRQGIAQMVEGDAAGLEGRSAEGLAPVGEQLLLSLRESAHQVRFLLDSGLAECAQRIHFQNINANDSNCFL